MDPLSVTASILGILGAAGKVVEIVEPFISSAKDAPKIAVAVYSEVNRVRIVLSSLQNILTNLSSSSTSSSRAAFVQVDQLVVTFTDGVLIFSELESMLNPLKVPDQAQLQLRQRLQWASKKNAISEVLDRLQRFQVSLSTMLNIFQCGSDIAAAQSQKALEIQMGEILHENRSLADRLRQVEDRFDAESTLRRRLTLSSETVIDAQEETDTVSALPDEDLASLTSSLTIIGDYYPSKSPFENDLDTSRVYRRAMKNSESRFSISSYTTSAIGSRAWSIFSGMSLADISVMSVIALPLRLADIKNPQHYTLGNFINEDSSNDITPAPNNNTLASNDDTSASSVDTPASSVDTPASSVDTPASNDDTPASNLYYDCVVLRSKLAALVDINGVPREWLPKADPDTSVFLQWLRESSTWEVLNETIEGIIDPFHNKSYYFQHTQDSKGPAYIFIRTCVLNLKWGLDAKDCFTVTDLYGDNSMGYQKVVRTLDRVLSVFLDHVLGNFSASIGVSGTVNAREAILKDDSLLPGPEARTAILRKFLKDERVYVAQLERLSSMKSSLLLLEEARYSPDDIVDLFGNVDILLDLHIRFLCLVEESKLEDDEDTCFWGTVFSEYRGTFQSCYVSYFENKKKSSDSAARLINQLKRAEKPAKLEDMMKTTGYLLRPAARFFEYINFLENLEANGQWNAKQRSLIKLGMKDLENIWQAADECFLRQEHSSRVERLVADVENWGGCDVKSFGQLILFGNFRCKPHDSYSSGKHDPPSKQYALYLFDTAILAFLPPKERKRGRLSRSNSISKSNPNALRLKGRIFFSSIVQKVSCQMHGGGSYSLDISYKSGHTGEPIQTFSIEFSDETLMVKWMVVLHKQHQSWCDNPDSPSAQATQQSNCKSHPPGEPLWERSVGFEPPRNAGFF